MNLHHHPQLLDRLAASYAVGTLRGAARRRFEAMARDHATVRAAALVWQGRMASLNELQPPQQPSPAVWTRIDNLIRGELEAQTVQNQRRPVVATANPLREGWRNLALWRFATAAGALATCVVVVTALGTRQQLVQEVASLQTQLQSTTEVGYVSVLSDDKAVAAMLVTFDPHNGQLSLQRVGGFREADDRSLQLWALAPGEKPRSLGVLGREAVLRLNAREADVRQAPMLAISLEPRGGVASATGPTGPVLFKGALIRKIL